MNNSKTISRKVSATKWDFCIRIGYLGFYLTIWMIDSFILKSTIFLANNIHVLIRLTLSIITIIVAFNLVIGGIKLVYGVDKKPVNKVIDSGIYKRVRHPVYLGFLLIYLAIFLTTLSITCFVLFIVAIIIFDRVASNEEKELIKFFGEEYLEYKKHVKKWFPF